MRFLSNTCKFSISYMLQLKLESLDKVPESVLTHVGI